MNEEKTKYLAPEKDLKVHPDSHFEGFLNHLSPDYFKREVSLPEETMEKVAENFLAAGKKDLWNYSPLDMVRKETRGVGVIVIDCSKIKPQENFHQLAEEKKLQQPENARWYELYSRQAFTLAVAIEATRQMLQYIKTKPFFRPENKHTTFFLEEVEKKAGKLTPVNAEKADDYHSSLCINLEQIARDLRLQQFTLIFTHAEMIPESAKKDFQRMQDRPNGWNNTRVMLLAKERSPKDIMEKIHEVRERLSAESSYGDASKDLVRALDWYQQARTSEEKSLRGIQDEKKRQAFVNQVKAISDYGHNFHDLHAEFRFFTDDEIRQIKDGIATL